MNSQIEYKDTQEIELINIFNFICRQRIFIVIFNLIIISSAFSYAITRPTTWQSNVSLLIGEKLYFTQQQQQLIESFDDIKYRYSKNADVSTIKNTRIVELSTTQSNKEISIEKINEEKNLIIFNHKQILEDKKTEFINLLNAISKDNANRTEFIRLLDNASSSTLTRQLTEVRTLEKKYSGIFSKIMGIGIFIGLILSLVLALIKDFIERKNKLRRSPEPSTTR